MNVTILNKICNNIFNTKHKFFCNFLNFTASKNYQASDRLVVNLSSNSKQTVNQQNYVEETPLKN